MAQYRGRYRYKKKASPSKGARRKKAAKKKQQTGTITRMKRQVRTLMKDQYDAFWLRYNSNIATTISPLNIFNILDPTQYTRLFTAGTDTAYTNTCWINKLLINYRFQLNENTPDTFPIYITMFLIQPKWMWREILGSTSATKLDVTSFTLGTTHSFGSQSAQSVLLNPEYMRIVYRKRFVLMPPIKATGGTPETYPSKNYYRTGQIRCYPKLRLHGATRTWKDIPAEDIAFTRQYAMLFFASFDNAASPISVNCNFWWDAMIKVNQVNN